MRENHQGEVTCGAAWLRQVVGVSVALVAHGSADTCSKRPFHGTISGKALEIVQVRSPHQKSCAHTREEARKSQRQEQSGVVESRKW